MHPLLRKFLGMNWLLFGLMMTLMLYGLYAIYSAMWFRETTYWKSQLAWMLELLARTKRERCQRRLIRL